MEPSLEWSSARPRLFQFQRARRVLGMVPLLTALGCSHPSTSKPEHFEKKPSAEALRQRDAVVAQLRMQDGDTDGIKKRLEERLASRRNQDSNAVTQGTSPIEALLLQELKCGGRGCYADFPASTAEATAQLNELVIGPDTPLQTWTGWRYLSGLYEGQDRQRRLTVVILNDRKAAKAGLK